jgi:uncharacterized membrane protein
MKRAALALVLAAGCADPAVPIEDMPCPPAGTTLTYASFGAGFFADHCNRCHSEARNGAPEQYRFDTVDEIRTHAARIFIRAAGPNVTMPPGPEDPPADARDQLAEWLACGAP